MDHLKDFIRGFEKLSVRHSAFKVFSDFCAMTAISISNSLTFSESREQEYLRIVKAYSPDEREMLPQMVAAIVQEMTPAQGKTPKYRDVLGGLFESLSLQDGWKGQFFTPQVVSDMMGQTVIRKSCSDIQKKGYVKCHEPCIGGGANVIGLVNAMFDAGLNPCKQLLVEAFDIDQRCIYMSYIQLSLMGIPAALQRVNTLTLEVFDTPWFTPIFILDAWADKLQLERMYYKFKQAIEVFGADKKKSPANDSSGKATQTTLF